MIRVTSLHQTNRQRSAGTVMVETAFVLLVFLGFIFLIIDESMAVFAKATLQHAVRMGVRYAVTSQTSGSLGQVDSIKQVVQAQAMGFLSNGDMSNYVKVNFCPVNSSGPECPEGPPPAGSNMPGNLVIIKVVGWPYTPIAPVLHSGASIPISVSSADLIETSGSGGSPPPL